MDHISYIGNKLSKGIAILYYVSRIINMDALRNLYCTLILPYLSYCAMVWGNTYTTNLVPLCLKQKKAIWIVCNVKYRGHTTELFYSMKLLTIYQIIEFQTGIYMYKAFHMKLSYSQQELFYLRDLIKQLQQVKVVPSYKHMYVLQKKQNCVSVTGIKLWNSIENYVEIARLNKLLRQNSIVF